MTLLPAILAVVALSVEPVPAPTKSHDPLWMRAQAALQANRALTASEIVSDTQIIDADGALVDSIHKSVKLTQWKDGQAVRSVVSLSEARKSGLGELKFEFGVANHPDEAMIDNGTVERAGNTMLDQKPCVLFNVTGTRKNQAFKAKAWIEEATSLPLKVDYNVDASPMAKSLTYTVVFDRDEQGRWLPSRMDIEAHTSLPFFKYTFTSKQVFKGWVNHP